MTETNADAIYDILVQHAGANGERASWLRQFFVANQSHSFGPREYRFGGSLGFGGKLYIEGDGPNDRWRVSCYPEDETPERLAAIRATNAALAGLRERIVGQQEIDAS